MTAVSWMVQDQLLQSQFALVKTTVALLETSVARAKEIVMMTATVSGPLSVDQTTVILVLVTLPKMMTAVSWMVQDQLQQLQLQLHLQLQFALVKTTVALLETSVARAKEIV